MIIFSFFLTKYQNFDKNHKSKMFQKFDATYSYIILNFQVSSEVIKKVYLESEEERISQNPKKNSKLILSLKMNLEGFSYNLQQPESKSAY